MATCLLLSARESHDIVSCRLIEAYEVHQKLQQQLQAVKKHRISADASQYVCWFVLSKEVITYVQRFNDYSTVVLCCCYSAPVGERCIAISLSVCLSTSISLELLDRSSQNLLCKSPVAVARSSSGSVAICYVLPVLWMTSLLAIVGRTAMCG